MKVVNLLLVLSLYILCSCAESEEKKINRITNEWMGKEISFPANILCIAGEDTVNYKTPNVDLTVFAYIDSAGCATFGQQIPKWKRFMERTQKLAKEEVVFLFFFASADIDEMRTIFREENFTYPVCFDVENKINRLNDFPVDVRFQTFLINSRKEVISVGNPALSEDVRLEYEKIIKNGGVIVPETATTKLEYDTNIINMGNFNWRSKRDTTVTIVNVGDKPLYVKGIKKQTDRLSLEYSRKAIPPGEALKLRIRYRAGCPEDLREELLIDCNIESGPLYLIVKGNAR